MFTYQPHTVSPSYCTVEVTCNNVSPDTFSGVQCKELQGGELTWTFGETQYKSGLSPPGTYTFTFDVDVNGGVTTDQFNFDIELTDPCTTAAVGTTKPTTIQAITYFITDTTVG